MMSLFKRERKTPQPIIRVSMHDDTEVSDRDLLPSVLDKSDERPRKLRKQSVPVQAPGKPAQGASRIASDSKAHGDDLNASPSSGNTTAQPVGSPVTLGIAEAVLDPNYYTTLLLQASDARYKSQNSSRPSTPPPPSPSKVSTYDTSPCVEVPPSTPSFYDSAKDSMNLSLNRKASSRTLDPIVEGVTYDAILTSTLNKTLAQEDDDYLVPTTQVPPNTPAPAIVQEGGFASLMCVSAAIMEGKVQRFTDSLMA